MSISGKVDRALYGPGVLEIAFGVVLGLALGVSLACVYLVLKPVQVVAVSPKEREKGVVYYQEGSKDAAKARAFLVKRQRYAEGSTVSFTEDEINAWVATWAAPQPAATAKTAAKPGDKAAPAAAPEGSLVPSAPNFRIHDGKLQIGLRCKLNLAAFGLSREVVVQAEGGFRKKGDRMVFAPDTVYFGSCPIHKLAGMAGPLVGKISSLYPTLEDIRGPWAGLTDVSVEGNALKLAVQ